MTNHDSICDLYCIENIISLEIDFIINITMYFGKIDNPYSPFNLMNSVI
jgi:hypothetical protein